MGARHLSQPGKAEWFHHSALFSLTSRHFSHYFQTALDLSFCIRGEGPDGGFYLIMAMGPEQAGLTGLKGSIVRKVALGRSVSNLQNALTRSRI